MFTYALRTRAPVCVCLGQGPVFGGALPEKEQDIAATSDSSGIRCVCVCEREKGMCVCVLIN